MDGEGIQRHVGDDAQLRETLTQRTGRTLGDALGVPGLGRIEGFLFQRRHREQRQRRDTQRYQLFGFLEQQVDGKPFHARHRRHLLATILSVEHEYRQNQVIDRQHVLAHQAAGEIVTPIAAQACGGEQSIGRNNTHNGLLTRNAGEYDVYRRA